MKTRNRPHHISRRSSRQRERSAILFGNRVTPFGHTRLRFCLQLSVSVPGMATRKTPSLWKCRTYRPIIASYAIKRKTITTPVRSSARGRGRFRRLASYLSRPPSRFFNASETLSVLRGDNHIVREYYTLRGLRTLVPSRKTFSLHGLGGKHELRTRNIRYSLDFAYGEDVRLSSQI